jgi:hypothetical protein
MWGAEPAQAVQSPPRKSVSYYVSTSSTTTAYNQGCSQGISDAHSPIQDSEVVLDFGGQNSANTGTKLINGTNVTYSQIAKYAEQFGYGYWICTGTDTTSVLELAIGTNNSYYDVNSTGGASWGNSVVATVKSWLNSHYAYQQVLAGGANDMEPSYHNATDTRAWVGGYSGTSAGWFDNYGSADGCSQTSYSNGGCNNGWRQADVYYVSWGNDEAYALPEIYYLSQSHQWTMISRYGYYYGNYGKIGFDGPMTEFGYNGSYDSNHAWNQFWTELNGSGTTAVNFSFRTDI